MPNSVMLQNLSKIRIHNPLRENNFVFDWGESLIFINNVIKVLSELEM